MGICKKTGKILFSFSCEDDYVPTQVRMGTYAPLTLLVAVYSNTEKGWSWCRLKTPALTLEEAKERAEQFFQEHPEIFVNKGES